MMSREDSEGQNLNLARDVAITILPETFADSQTSKIELRNSANFS